MPPFDFDRFMMERTISELRAENKYLRDEIAFIRDTILAAAEQIQNHVSQTTPTGASNQ
jgi:hypothetical protein